MLQHYSIDREHNVLYNKLAQYERVNDDHCRQTPEAGIY
jgi:hypothetical protein